MTIGDPCAALDEEPQIGGQAIEELAEPAGREESSHPRRRTRLSHLTDAAQLGRELIQVYLTKRRSAFCLPEIAKGVPALSPRANAKVSLSVLIFEKFTRFPGPVKLVRVHIGPALTFFAAAESFGMCARTDFLFGLVKAARSGAETICS
jgi:hypothetical protein